MNIRNFDKSELDTKELLSMFIDLQNDNNDNLTYAEQVGVLFSTLYMPNCNCFMVEKDDTIAGFIILYPDAKGGSFLHSILIKEQFRNTFLFSNVVDWIEDFVSSNYQYCMFNALNEKTNKLYGKRYDKHATVYKFISKGKL